MTPQEFIRRLAPLAQEEQRKHRLRASVTIAQAALESRWGSSKLAVEANNLFGIKGEGPAGYIELPTTELVEGRWVRTTARFRKYRDWRECLEDRSRILTTLDRYAEVTRAATPEAQAWAIQRGGWATDPAYAEKIITIIRQFGLELCDGPFTDVPPQHWAAQDIALVTGAGIMGGYPDGTFRPESTVTRAELASALARLLQREVRRA